MKVLHIGKFYAPIEGGIESINHVVVDALKGNQQRIITFNNKNISIEEDVDDIPVVRASSLGVLASQPLSFRYLLEIRRAIKIFKPDIVHFHYPNPLGTIFLRLSIKNHNKLIVHWHSDIVAQKYMKKFFKPLENWLLMRADSIIATSPSYLEASVISMVKQKITVIPCSINEDNFIKKESDEESINRFKIQYGNRPIVLFVGRHVEYKGIKYLLEAEKQVKSDCVFVIAGQGPLTESLQQTFKSKRVYWIGRISDDAMRQLMYAATIFVFPSITRNEAFGVALAEAMYCGCPTVTFTVNGSGVNWVSPDQECGIEVPNGDYMAFANAIDELLINDTKRTKFARNAHCRVSGMFTKSIVIPQYIKLYQDLVTK